MWLKRVFVESVGEKVYCKRMSRLSTMLVESVLLLRVYYVVGVCQIYLLFQSFKLLLEGVLLLHMLWGCEGVMYQPVASIVQSLVWDPWSYDHFDPHYASQHSQYSSLCDWYDERVRVKECEVRSGSGVRVRYSRVGVHRCQWVHTIRVHIRGSWNLCQERCVKASPPIGIFQCTKCLIKIIICRWHCGDHHCGRVTTQRLGE